MTDCDFCYRVRNETPNRIALLKSGVGLLNFNQTYKGASIFAFIHHVESLKSLSREECYDFFRGIARLSTAIENAYNADWVNYAFLMNKERHLHCHIIPRYEGDSNWLGPPWPMKPGEADAEGQSAIAWEIRRHLK